MIAYRSHPKSLPAEVRMEKMKECLKSVMQEEDLINFEMENLLYGCYTNIIVWREALAYQEVSSLEDKGCGDGDASLDVCCRRLDRIKNEVIRGKAEVVPLKDKMREVRLR